MKIALVLSIFALVLCQFCQNVESEETCESIGCSGNPFRLCLHDANGKPYCRSLGVGPVVTCETKQCEPGYHCVNVGQCVADK